MPLKGVLLHSIEFTYLAKICPEQCLQTGTAFPNLVSLRYLDWNFQLSNAAGDNEVVF